MRSARSLLGYFRPFRAAGGHALVPYTVTGKSRERTWHAWHTLWLGYEDHGASGSHMRCRGFASHKGPEACDVSAGTIVDLLPTVRNSGVSRVPQAVHSDAGANCTTTSVWDNGAFSTTYACRLWPWYRERRRRGAIFRTNVRETFARWHRLKPKCNLCRALLCKYGT